MKEWMKKYLETMKKVNKMQRITKRTKSIVLHGQVEADTKA